jgi:low affinity Fe/Cu permease
MERIFGRAAGAVAHATGRPASFILCCTIVIIWAVSGPIFGFSDTWQLIINTGTTIVTFLMVFLIQNTQNRDGTAVQAKLDELIRVSRGKNDFIGIEHLSEAEVEEFRSRCEAAARGSSAPSSEATAARHRAALAEHEREGERGAAEIRKANAKRRKKASARKTKAPASAGKLNGSRVRATGG